MNPEFKKRHEQVLEVLSMLSKEAKRQDKKLVFIGGSAVQAILPKPMRLSIDLDVHYPGNPKKLLECLQPEFEVSERPSRNDEQFQFFEAAKKGVLVKIDIARFGPPAKGKPYKLTKIGSFKALTATPEYLLAEKLSALAIGTIGRKKEKKDFQTDFLKDVVDSNQLIGFTKPTGKACAFFESIVKIQNHLRKTRHSTDNTIQSIVSALIESIKVEDVIITKGGLQNFKEYLFGQSIRKPDYWEMAAKVAAYAKIALVEKKGFKTFKKIEDIVQTGYADREKANHWQEKLKSKGVGPELLHELKIIAPKRSDTIISPCFQKNNKTTIS
jgi:hypothetical protein